MSGTNGTVPAIYAIFLNAAIVAANTRRGTVYRNLFERKLSKLESLRQAQIWLLNNPDIIEGKDLTVRGQVREVKATDPDALKSKANRSLPAYWAAFQLSGDPR
jgi:CHAT domain-containing protein